MLQLAIFSVSQNPLALRVLPGVLRLSGDDRMKIRDNEIKKRLPRYFISLGAVRITASVM